MIHPEEAAFADIAPTCPQERKNRCSQHVGPKIQNKSPHVLQCSQEGGEVVSRSKVSPANFSPSPFLGACVTACDTLPREHGCRGNVYTCYTFVTCHVSDTLFPGWVFLAQVWAGGGFWPPPPHPPLCLVNRLTVGGGGCILGKTCHLSIEEGTLSARLRPKQTRCFKLSLFQNTKHPVQAPARHPCPATPPQLFLHLAGLISEADQ